MMANDLREKICQAIASLDKDAVKEDVESKLKLLLDQAVAAARLVTEEALTPPELDGSSSSSSSSSNISPLLVASDRGNVASLLLLTRYYNYDTTATVIFGSPLDPSPEQHGGNTPVHHAAMSGCNEAWEIFANILLKNNYNKQTTLSSAHDEFYSKEEKEDQQSIFITLASLTNAHGDTPLQMAVAAGHLEFLQQWYKLITTTKTTTTATSSTTTTCSSSQGGEGTMKQIIQTILQQTNQAGDTCASLACCHGHVDIVDFLLNTCHVSISHNEITKCQQTVTRMDQTLSTVIDPTALETFHDRQARVYDCFNKLQVTVAQQAEDAANELLQLLVADNDKSKATNAAAANGDNHKTCSSTKKKKKKNKTKGNNKKAVINNNKNNDKATSTSSSSSSSVSATGDEEPFYVTRLNDGRVAVSVQGQFSDMIGSNNSHYDESSLQHFPFLLATTTTTLPSPDTMLRQRFRLRENDNNNDKNSRHHHEHDIDAVMDALCLDVSMLLYTPHGMALNLSPSQLDAVQQILEKQIHSVQQARNLQHRMHTNQSNQQQH